MGLEDGCRYGGKAACLRGTSRGGEGLRRGANVWRHVEDDSLGGVAPLFLLLLM